jgi:hypothetical protein
MSGLSPNWLGKIGVQWHRKQKPKTNLPALYRVALTSNQEFQQTEVTNPDRSGLWARNDPRNSVRYITQRSWHTVCFI